MLRPGALPRYIEIAEFLGREIAAGNLRDGERLPTEREMAQSLGVAVGTLRQALARLADRGLLDRVQGSGNYVRARPDPAAVYALFRLELTTGGGLPTAQVLSVDRLPLDPSLPPCGPGPEGHRIRRLRLLSGRPVAVEEIWLDGARIPRLRAEDLSDSLYLFYRTRLGLSVARAEDRIGQSPLPHWSPAEFPVAPGTALPSIARRGATAADETVEISRTWYDPDQAAYVARQS